ncbi:hypothetical protein PL373_14605 [Tenacibaculum maritimum]|nr:hypothetical protein [Tenacibaculum maritimum]MDB0602349.1 hypothetical protein [Tenacibaculum maritimum]MDB0613490.1 hypothetical protein [Tenacibaculum maritimum]
MNNKAKIKVEQFLNAWKENNHIKMYELTSKTWRAKHSKKQLKQLLPKRIKSFKVEEITEFAPCIYDVNITLRVGGKTKKVTARLLCESEPYKPSVDGVFGINPISIIKNLY